MRLSDLLITFVAKRFRIPDLAVRMFRAASRLSGLDTSTLPVELLPLNSIQMSRGLLNFTVLQTLERWVLPYWAERQYDPAAPEFVPRSHLGMSMNITHRNWTAAGHPSCPIEPIVDPRGLVTPHPDGWSLDAWLRTESETLFPSRVHGVHQALVDSAPIVHTEVPFAGMRLSSLVYTSGQCAVIRYRVANPLSTAAHASLGIAIRPFNPEGVALIDLIDVHDGGRTLHINGVPGISADRPPSCILMSDRDHGDVAWRFTEGAVKGGETRVACAAGLCTSVMLFALTLPPGGSDEVVVTCPLQPDAKGPRETPEAARDAWRHLRALGSRYVSPGGHMADLFAASQSALLASLDGTTIRPGPATYHYFWYRDAAYMLLALDRLGYGTMTRRVFERFPESQDRSGMFRSQQGEWDSTGQAIWSVWQHAVLTHDTQVALQLFDSLHAGVRWIDRKRMREPGDPLLDGLMPRGLSAEHLGLADVYYWDMFWSLAGVEAFERICHMLQRPEEEVFAHELAAGMRRDLERSIEEARSIAAVHAIPAGPLRGIDAGIIGSVVAWYPLQVLPPEDLRMQATVQEILDHRFIQGMFYQPFVHSGLNAYLTLHVAGGVLHRGDAEGFWRIIEDVARHASPTFTFPEAIHPQTGGGCMGDGHHGWAAAEIVMAIRNAFVYDIWGPVGVPHTVRLLSGIPAAMFDQHQPFGMMRVPVPEGYADITVSPSADAVAIDVTLDREGQIGHGYWELSLPTAFARIMIDERPILASASQHGRYSFPLPPGSAKIIAHRDRSLSRT